MEVKTINSDGAVTVTNYDEPKPGDSCCRCGERPGIVEVHGIPGGISYWCELCLVRVDLEHAIGQAAKIPELKARLARLLDG